MKAPLSHHIAIAVAETARHFPRLAWVAVALVLAFAAAAIAWNAWWLWILAAMTLGDAVILYLGKGICGILETDPEDVAALRRKYRWSN